MRDGVPKGLLQRLLAALGIMLGVAAAASAQPAEGPTLYKYTDENGVQVFTDRRPTDSEAFDTAPLDTRARAGSVRLYQRVGADQSVQLVARNDYLAPVQVAYGLVTMRNLDASTPTTGRLVVPARAELELLTLKRADPARPMQLEYGFRYVLGDPAAQHRPEQAYRLPYALAQAFVVSQAYPNTVTHGNAASRHAVDFTMPVGTAVYAARAGTVIDVAGDFFEAGTNPERDSPRANIVRVLHDDGTIALYAHLNWNSIRVTPGQRVARGEYLADSGNTGFSTGPHLHFVVQRNAGGGLESVPVRFAGPGGGELVLSSGDEPTAY